MRRSLIAIACAAVVAAVAGVALAQAGSSVSTTALRAEPVASLKATVLADPSGRTLYQLTPETPKHLLCTSAACLALWPPATVASRSVRVKLPKGAKGKVSFLRRGRRFQIVVAGRPLYRYAADTRPRQARGQHIASFGGVWSVRALGKATTQSPPAGPPPNPYGY